MVYLLFPILFMLHDFEEIIWGHNWLKENIDSIKAPKLVKTALTYVANLSTRQFIFVVMEEFILCTLISICAFYGRMKGLFLGIMVGYIFHCFMHFIQCIYIKRYIPLVVSAIITGIVTLILVMHFSVKISIIKLLWDGLIGSLLIIVNLFFSFFISRLI